LQHSGKRREITQLTLTFPEPEQQTEHILPLCSLLYAKKHIAIHSVKRLAPVVDFFKKGEIEDENYG